MRVFIAVDGSAHAEVVAQAAAHLLRRVDQPDITLGTVIDASEAFATAERTPNVEVPRDSGWAGTGGFYIQDTPSSARTLEDRAQAFSRLRAEVDYNVRRLAREHLAQYDVKVHVEAAEEAGRTIAQRAERLGAELLIMGTHGRTGLRRVVLGSVAQAAVHLTDVPAILVRTLPESTSAPGERLPALLPTDGSARVRAALPRVGALAAALGADVTLIRVMDVPELTVESTLEAQRGAVQEEVEEELAALETVGVHARWEVLEGYPPRAVINYAQEHGAELVLVPTHDRSEAGRLVFGSVADQLVHDLPCPIGLVKARPV